MKKWEIRCEQLAGASTPLLNLSFEVEAEDIEAAFFQAEQCLLLLGSKPRFIIYHVSEIADDA